jgi:SEC-C motif
LGTPAKTLGRNDPCHCGSGRKYKQCCLAKDEAVAREARAKEAAQVKPQAAAEAPAPAAGAAARAARPQTHQPWKKGNVNARGFQRVSAPRKVGSG